MDDLMDAIREVDNSHRILEADFAYLARCYLAQDTNFELPMNNVTDEVSCDYATLMRGVKRRILELDPTCVIDDVQLMSYLDYYYQFISISTS